MIENKKSKNQVTRGRTGVDLPPAMKITEKGLKSGSREETAHSADRPDRISMSNMKKLEVPPFLLEDGYYYRWFQDKDGRISQAKAAYYEHVVDEQGNNFCRASGRYSMYLMRLRQEYRDEDNKLKKARVAATLESETQIGTGEYAPDPKTGKAEGGISAVRHSISDSQSYNSSSGRTAEVD